MYLKTLTTLTLCFLAVLFVVMVQTVPNATSFQVANHEPSLIKVICTKNERPLASPLKHI
ncbi:hypothetical protein [Sneathiella aquimaris]|uniref:hypothetical protein n=1 Tax=Sneathiella aquimaris TaxID=2599305 RepID=UPI00146BA819|nr:hypothetical protein [Sneathiella aquimaris]